MQNGKKSDKEIFTSAIKLYECGATKTLNSQVIIYGTEVKFMPGYQSIKDMIFPKCTRSSLSEVVN